MMWEAWQTRQATGQPTSRLFQKEIHEAAGASWLEAASDLDQAVYEWGTFVESKIDTAVSEYYKAVDKGNANRAKMNKGGSSFHESYSRERVSEIHQEVLQYWVHGMVREYTDVPGDTLMSAPGRAYQEREATWNPKVDKYPDWDAPGTSVVYLDRPSMVEPEEPDDEDD